MRIVNLIRSIAAQRCIGRGAGIVTGLHVVKSWQGMPLSVAWEDIGVSAPPSLDYQSLYHRLLNLAGQFEQPDANLVILSLEEEIFLSNIARRISEIGMKEGPAAAQATLEVTEQILISEYHDRIEFHEAGLASASPQRISGGPASAIGA